MERYRLDEKERLQEFTKPMGEIQKYHHEGYGITKWYPNYGRLRRLKKMIQGPLQRSYIRRKYDPTGDLIYPSERHVIKKYLNSQGEIVKIYDTDEERTIDKVRKDYFMVYNIWDMQDVIEGGKVPKEKYADEFFKRIYEDITYDWVYYNKVDPIFK